LAQIRHRGVCVAAELVRLDAEIELALEEPLSAITPGQSVVLYEGDTVLGGAIIEQTGARQLGRHALPLAVA
jgi:tRNA-specific 2-thiouridylase